jgi:hypothetical protein
VRTAVNVVKYGPAYIAALLVGLTAVRIFSAMVERLFGVVTGPAALVVGVASGVASGVGLVIITAWMFSIFAAAMPSYTRSKAQH